VLARAAFDDAFHFQGRERRKDGRCGFRATGDEGLEVGFAASAPADSDSIQSSWKATGLRRARTLARRAPSTL